MKLDDQKMTQVTKLMLIQIWLANCVSSLSCLPNLVLQQSFDHEVSSLGAEYLLIIYAHTCEM